MKSNQEKIFPATYIMQMTDEDSGVQYSAFMTVNAFTSIEAVKEGAKVLAQSFLKDRGAKNASVAVELTIDNPDGEFAEQTVLKFAYKNEIMTLLESQKKGEG